MWGGTCSQGEDLTEGKAWLFRMAGHEEVPFLSPGRDKRGDVKQFVPGKSSGRKKGREGFSRRRGEKDSDGRKWIKTPKKFGTPKYKSGRGAQGRG